MNICYGNKMKALIRSQTAQILNETRNMYYSLQGDWSRREWYKTCRATARSFQRSTIIFHLSNENLDIKTRRILCNMLD